MKATGLVRRIDDLGRVAVPKEIRRMLHLREGDPLEIYIEDGKLIFRRYNPLAINSDAQEMARHILSDIGFTRYAVYDTFTKLFGAKEFPRELPDEIRIACQINENCEWLELELPGEKLLDRVQMYNKICVARIMADKDLIGYLVCDANEIPASLSDVKDASLVKRLQLLQVAKTVSHLCTLSN